MLSLTTSSTGVRPSALASSTAVVSKALPMPRTAAAGSTNSTATAASSDAGNQVPSHHPSASHRADLEQRNVASSAASPRRRPGGELRRGGR